MMSVLILQLWPQLLVGTIHFEDRLCTSEKGGIVGGGWAYSGHAVHTHGGCLGSIESLWSALAGPYLPY